MQPKSHHDDRPRLTEAGWRYLGRGYALTDRALLGIRRRLPQDLSDDARERDRAHG